MLQPKRARLPEPLATGVLAKRPLTQLLVYALARQLSGSFELKSEANEEVHITIANGLVWRVATSVPVIYLGHALYESGTIDGTQLSTSLAEVATSKRLHGQILLEKGIVFPDQLAAGLRLQRARKLHHAFGLSPRTTFAFYSRVDLVGERPNDVDPTDPLPLIWCGLRAHPSWEHVRATVATIAGDPLRVTGSLERLGLRTEERAAADRLRRTPATVKQLAELPGMDSRSAELLAHFLAITKIAEIVLPVAAAEPPRAPDSKPDLGSGKNLGVALDSGEYIRKVSFAMRAVSPDREPIRIPSPMPGRMLAVPGRPVTRPPDQPPPSVGPKSAGPKNAPSHAADQSLSQAEMHMLLGEREQAVTCVRRALAESPGMPEALAFLAHVEAAALAPGQEVGLRHDLLKMVDKALAVDATCRRARFYRADIKTRLSDHEGAIRDLRVAVTQDPDDAAAHRELRAYQQRVRDGSVVIRSMSPFAGTPKPVDK